MRGLESNKTKIRHKIFTEIARVAYEGSDISKEIVRLPYKIIPGEVATYRDSIFLERAIVGERLRLAMGLPIRNVAEQVELNEGVDESAIAEKYYPSPGERHQIRLQQVPGEAGHRHQRLPGVL